MKFKLFTSLSILAVLAVVASVAVAAKDPKDAKSAKAVAAPNKKAELIIDPSPVSEGKSPVVTSYADVVESVQKAVVSIYSSKTVRERVAVNPFFRQFGIPDQERESKQEGLGSGVIVSPDGYILTNNHVVEGADELKVLLPDDREYIAKVIGTDPKTDVAVVKIEADKLPVITLADSAKIRVGDVVFAVGNPLGIGQTVTMGIVSAKGRAIPGLADDGVAYQDFIQTDAAINMGNSGGALVDAKGRLVGINSAILSPTRGNIGIGFAIPTNLAASIMNSLIATGKVARGFLGVRPDLNAMTPDVAEQLGLPKGSRGVVIADLDTGSPAEKAGLKPLDVIVAINEHTVTTLDDLRFTIAQLIPGSVAKLKIFRDGKDKVVEVTLGTLIDNPNELVAGVNVTPLLPDMRRKLGISDPRVTGLVVTDVAEDSPFRNRLTTDVVIREINRVPVTDLASAKAALNPPGERNLLAIYYHGSPTFLLLTIPQN
jgi:serine protease Do/serine protease DegQ